MELDELREHVGAGPSDRVLQRLLDAAKAAFDGRYGVTRGTVSESLRPSGSLLFLSSRATAITSISEGDTEVDDADYALLSDGKRVRRLSDGNSTDWRETLIDVTYTRPNYDPERNRVLVALVDYELNFKQGLSGTTVGSWAEQYPQADQSYQRGREAILRSYRSPTVGVW